MTLKKGLLFLFDLCSVFFDFVETKGAFWRWVFFGIVNLFLSICDWVFFNLLRVFWGIWVFFSICKPVFQGMLAARPHRGVCLNFWRWNPDFAPSAEAAVTPCEGTPCL
jgi:hypothetical protein